MKNTLIYAEILEGEFAALPILSEEGVRIGGGNTRYRFTLSPSRSGDYVFSPVSGNGGHLTSDSRIIVSLSRDKETGKRCRPFVRVLQTTVTIDSFTPQPLFGPELPEFEATTFGEDRARQDAAAQMEDIAQEAIVLCYALGEILKAIERSVVPH